MSTALITGVKHLELCLLAASMRMAFQWQSMPGSSIWSNMNRQKSSPSCTGLQPPPQDPGVGSAFVARVRPMLFGCEVRDRCGFKVSDSAAWHDFLERQSSADTELFCVTTELDISNDNSHAPESTAPSIISTPSAKLHSDSLAGFVVYLPYRTALAIRGAEAQRRRCPL